MPDTSLGLPPPDTRALPPSRIWISLTQGYLLMLRSSLLQRRWHHRDFAGLGKSSCYGNSLCRNKNRPSFATFLRLRTLLRPHKVEMSRQKGRFAAFFDRDPRFGASRQSAIAKKLQFGPIFCFWVPGADFGWGRHARANVGYGSSL